MEKHSEDQKLALRIRNGDSGAFKELVDHHQNHVLNTCYRFLLNREDAEDTAQEVFVEVFRSIRAFEGKSKLSTWIYRIAVNKSLDFLRKEKRKKRSAAATSSLDSGDRFRPEYPDDKENPEQHLELSENMEVLKAAVSRLPENQRVVFTLSKYDGISNKEIAEILGTSLSSVESLMHRAKTNLRKKLFSHFKKDLKRGGKLLILIFIILISQIRDLTAGFNIFRLSSDIPQDFKQCDVKSVDQGKLLNE